MPKKKLNPKKNIFTVFDNVIYNLPMPVVVEKTATKEDEEGYIHVMENGEIVQTEELKEGEKYWAPIPLRDVSGAQKFYRGKPQWQTRIIKFEGVQFDPSRKVFCSKIANGPAEQAFLEGKAKDPKCAIVDKDTFDRGLNPALFDLNSKNQELKEALHVKNIDIEVHLENQKNKDEENQKLKLEIDQLKKKVK